MTPQQQKGHLATFVTNLLFGVNIPIARTILPMVIIPTAMTQLRFVGAAVAFWILSFFLPKEHVPLKDLGKLFFASLFAILLNQSLFIVGLARTSSTDASIMITFTPVLTMVLAAFFLKEPVTWKKVSGVFLGMAGALLLIFNGADANMESNGKMYGNILCLLSGLSYAVYLTAFKSIIVKYNAITLMKWMFLFSAILFLPFSSSDMLHFNWENITWIEWIKIAYVVFVATFLTYLLIPIAQKNIRPTTMTMYNNMQPLIAAGIAIMLGMDQFSIVKVVAALLIFFGVYVVTKSKSREQLEKERQEIENSNLM